MINMLKIKLILLNIICSFILLFFMVLSWQYFNISATIQINDYAMFYKLLRTPGYTYRKMEGVKISKMETKGNTVILTHEPAQGAVNLNTPLMSDILKALVTVSNKIIINTTVWFIISFICTAISISIVLRRFDDEWRNSYFYLPILTLFWLTWPLLFNINTGEIGLFLLSFLCAAYYFEETEQPIYSALTLGLLASLKLFFLIFILLFIVKKQWKAIILFLISFLVFFFLPLIYHPSSYFAQFFQQMQNTGEVIGRSGNVFNASILGFYYRLLLLLKIKISHAKSVSFSYLFTLLVMSLFLIYDNKKLQHLEKFSDEIRFCFLVILALLCSPLSWLYYFVFLLIPAIVIIKISQHYQFPNYFYFLLFSALTLPFLTMLETRNIFGMIARNFSVFASLVSWLFCFMIIAKAISKNKKGNAMQQKKIITLIVFTIVLGVFLLPFNNAIPYFLILDKSGYIENVKPGVWLNDQK